MARQLTDGFDGFLLPHSHLIHDRDPLFTARVADILRSAGVEPARLPPRSPNLNAFAERFVRSIRAECLDKMIPFGESHLRHIIDEYVEHYNRERPHQGVGNEPLHPPPTPARSPVECHIRLGGLLRSHTREAA